MAAAAAVQQNDIEVLTGRISPEWGPWGEEICISQESVNAFAALTGDSQWIHTDPVRAATSPFGGTIVHGFFLLALLSALAPFEQFKLPGRKFIINSGGQYNFISSVPCGSIVHARIRLLSVEPKGRGVLATFHYEIAAVGKSQPAVAGATIVYYR